MQIQLCTLVSCATNLKSLTNMNKKINLELAPKTNKQRPISETLRNAKMCALAVGKKRICANVRSKRKRAEASKRAIDKKCEEV